MRFEGQRAEYPAEKIEVMNEGSEKGFNIPIFAIDPKFPEYAAALQDRIEKEGSMDYHKYAVLMWTDLTGEAPEEENPFFKSFEHGMIRDLHTVDMRKLVYPEVMESLPELFGKWAKDVKKVMFYAEDAAAGNEAQRIGGSGIMPQLFRGVLGELGTEDARKFLEDKTEYVADDHAFGRAGEYLARELGDHPGEAKIVVVEDSAPNFEKVKKTIKDRFPEEAERIRLIPIWATYSQEGHQAERKARTSEEQAALWEKKHDLNAIGSFRELLEEKCGELVKDGYVLVDFDGVIGETSEMRKRQAEAIYNNFIRAYANSRALSVKDAEAKIREHLGK